MSIPKFSTAALALILMSIVVSQAAASEPSATHGDPAGNYSQGAEHRSALLDQMITRAQPGSRVRVIVGLDREFVPLGRLSRGQRDQQRNAIKQMQATFATKLPRGRFTEKRRLVNMPFMVIEIDAAQLALLKSMPEIASIEEDKLHRPSLLSSNAVIGSPNAWSEGYDGAAQAVAILDTGVDATHPYFNTNSKLIAEACFSSNYATHGATSACPGGVESSTAEGSGGVCSTADCYHGTHVAGIAVGNDTVGPNFGVARGANLIAVQVFSDFVNAGEKFCGSLTPCSLSYVSDQIAALDYIYSLRNTYDIAAINMSLGGGYSDSTCDAFEVATKAAFDNLRSVGIAPVVATGNASNRIGMAAPACISSAISVGSTDDNDSVASYSNIADFISLLAPGSGITSSIPGGGTGRYFGTSMAAPQVAGTWAVLKQAKPDASIDEILQALADTGTLVDDNRGGGTVTGMRRINVDLALNALLPDVIEGLSGSYVPITGCRVVDSRAALFSLSPLVEISFLAGKSGQDLGLQGGDTGGCDIPENASALQVNFTVIAQGTKGFFRAWANPDLEPNATVLVWDGSSVSNAFSLPICTGESCFSDFVVKPYGNWTDIDLVVDIFGYYIQ